MQTDLQLRMWETGLATLHEVRELRREVAMGKRRTRGWTRHIPNPRLIPWIVAAFLLAGGHLSVAELKGMLGLAGR